MQNRKAVSYTHLEEKAKIQSLPKTLDEALDALEADHDYLTAGGVFPERLIEICLLYTSLMRSRGCRMKNGRRN